MVDPNLVSLAVLGLSVVQTVALAWIAAKYRTAVADAAAVRSDLFAVRALHEAAKLTALPAPADNPPGQSPPGA